MRGGGLNRRADVVQDAEELLAAGEIAEAAARRMGMTAGAIARSLYRADRPDLARPFQAAARRASGRRDNRPWTPERAEMQRRRRARQAGRAA